MSDVDDAIARARINHWDPGLVRVDRRVLAAEVKRLQEALDRCRKGTNTWDDK